jgi:hypothetical protein
MTKWLSSLIESAVRKVLAEDQFKSLVASSFQIDYQKLAEELHERDGINYRELAEYVDEEEIAQHVDTTDIESKVIELIDTDSIVDNVANEIDTDEIADRIKDDVVIDYGEIDIDYEQLGRSLVELAHRG